MKRMMTRRSISNGVPPKKIGSGKNSLIDGPWNVAASLRPAATVEPAAVRDRGRAWDSSAVSCVERA